MINLCSNQYLMHYDGQHKTYRVVKIDTEKYSN